MKTKRNENKQTLNTKGVDEDVNICKLDSQVVYPEDRGKMCIRYRDKREEWMSDDYFFEVGVGMLQLLEVANALHYYEDELEPVGNILVLTKEGAMKWVQAYLVITSMDIAYVAVRWHESVNGEWLMNVAREAISESEYSASADCDSTFEALIDPDLN